MNVNTSVAIRVKELCQKKILTIKELSNISGLSESTIKNVYNDTAKRIRRKMIFNLCNTFGITIECFFNCDIFNERNT